MNVIDQTVTDRFSIYHSDCVEVVRALPDASVHFSIFSPPFASLYTYSNSARDLGNVKNECEFLAHFAFLATELFRVLKPGRLVSIHCMDLPTTKAHHGYIGLQDFRGDLIRAMQAVGFIFHSSVVIWKNPVTAMQRTKALGLLHKQLKKDAAMSRQGLPDYLVTLRKPGANDEPVTNTNESFPVSVWQRYASPVWVTTGAVDDEGFLDCSDAERADDDASGIDATDTLQGRSAREENDEKHICPLQLGVIRRAVKLWSNPNDIVLSPFTGIGSEGYVSLQEGRRFVGAELKKSYYEQAARNLAEASVVRQASLFNEAV